MSTYTIGEVADRSGFSASALRYYEGIGLVPPATRTDAGYRVYDDHTLARLAFIARAKALGCSLEEITDLVSIWDGERCGPVQRRFHDLVTAKIDDAQRQAAELQALTTQLRSAAAQLEGPVIDGPCDDGCACVSVSVDPPIACTLDAGALPDRLSEWRALLDHARARTAVAGGGLRVAFDDVALDDLTRLVVAEHQCCVLLLRHHRRPPWHCPRGARPDGAEDVVASLFGSPS